MKMRMVQVQFIVPSSLIYALFVVGVLTVTATELASEAVTLTTYYPAPSGVYSQMITTGDTALGRDGGRLTLGHPTLGSVTVAGQLKLANMTADGNGAVGSIYY